MFLFFSPTLFLGFFALLADRILFGLGGPFLTLFATKKHSPPPPLAGWVGKSDKNSQGGGGGSKVDFSSDVIYEWPLRYFA